jgi:hypothetical protein
VYNFPLTIESIQTLKGPFFTEKWVIINNPPLKNNSEANNPAINNFEINNPVVNNHGSGISSDNVSLTSIKS